MRRPIDAPWRPVLPTVSAWSDGRHGERALAPRCLPRKFKDRDGPPTYLALAPDLTTMPIGQNPPRVESGTKPATDVGLIPHEDGNRPSGEIEITYPRLRIPRGYGARTR